MYMKSLDDFLEGLLEQADLNDYSKEVAAQLAKDIAEDVDSVKMIDLYAFQMAYIGLCQDNLKDMIALNNLQNTNDIKGK